MAHFDDATVSLCGPQCLLDLLLLVALTSHVDNGNRYRVTLSTADRSGVAGPRRGSGKPASAWVSGEGDRREPDGSSGRTAPSVYRRGATDETRESASTSIPPLRLTSATKRSKEA